MIDQFLEIGLRTQVPGLLIGDPGVGKSASIVNWGKKRKLQTWVVIASLREPTDFAGLPVVSKETFTDTEGNKHPLVNFAPPSFAAEASVNGGLIFLDEITTAPPAVQAALLRVVLDHAFGDLQLDPKKVAIVAAANPPELAAGGWDLAPPLANRFRHRTFNLVPKEWCEKFPTYWDNVPDLGFEGMKLDERMWSQARSLVAGFLNARPAQLLSVPKEETRRGGAWPSPRTWDFASRQLAAIMQDGISNFEAMPYVADCVGEGCATEFMTWVREIDLPDPWELLKDPKKFKLHSRGDVNFAILSAVTAAAVSDLTEKHWLAAWTILGKAAKDGAKDVAAASSKILAEKHKSNLPLPSKDLLEFAPLLRSAGLYKNIQ